MAAEVALQFLALFLCFIGAEAWRCAKYQHYFSQQPDYIDCVWDCCGNSFNRHCCAPIGIIVGISIVGAVVVAALVVLLACWWQRRRAKYSKGPRLFHNRKHSHYPVAPTSVTRPAPHGPGDIAAAPLMPYRSGGPDEGTMYRPPPTAFRPRPGPGEFDAERKVPPTDFYEPGEPRGPPQGYRQGPPPQGQGYRPGPPPPQGQGYRQGPPPQGNRPRPPYDGPGYRQGPPPPGQAQRQDGPRPSRPPVQEYFD